MSEQHRLMAFREGGTANGEAGPVVFLHGFLSSSTRDWPDAQWAEPLGEAGQRLILADLPAHGEAPDPAGPEAATVSALVDDLAERIFEAGGTADILAYSLGARLAWSLAARHPARVRRMVLGGLGPHDPFVGLDYAAARRMAEGGPSPEDPMTAMLAGFVVGAGERVEARLDLMQALSHEPFDPEREKPAMPVLLITGSEDRMCAETPVLAAALDDCRHVSVPGDHLGALHHQRFREEALAFLNRTP